MERTIALFTPPLILMNALAGIVSAIWLVVLGQWQIPVYGLVITIIFPYAYAIVTLPLALVFGLGANALQNAKMNKASSGTMLVFNAVSDAIHFGWVLLVFSFLLSVMEVENLPLLPILLAGYAISTGGLSAMASREQHNEFTMMSTFVLQVVTFLVVVYIFIGLEILTIPTMILAMIVHGVIVHKVFKAENEYRSFIEHDEESET
jgi:hypothetical protein